MTFPAAPSPLVAGGFSRPSAVKISLPAFVLQAPLPQVIIRPFSGSAAGWLALPAKGRGSA